MNQDRMRRVLQDLVYLPALKDSSDSKAQPLTSPLREKEASAAGCRPWERQDLSRRLRTYKASTWFCKPAKADAVACARNGWINSSTDRLACECCGAHLDFKLLPGLSKQDQEKVSAEFAGKLQKGHNPGCPWIGNACDENLASYPPLPQSQVLAAYQSRLANLQHLSYLPALSEKAVQKMSSTHRSQLAALLTLTGTTAAGTIPDCSSHGGSDSLSRVLELITGDTLLGKEAAGFGERAKLLACCGWDAHVMPATKSAELRRWDATSGEVGNAHRAFLYCSGCGARTGLWSFLPLTTTAGPSPSSSRGAQGARPAGNMGDVIASLSQSIAGAAGRQASGGNSPTPGFGKLADKFGRQNDVPIFRSLSRSLSCCASVGPSATQAVSPSAAALQPRSAPTKSADHSPGGPGSQEQPARDLTAAFAGAAVPAAEHTPAPAASSQQAEPVTSEAQAVIEKPTAAAADAGDKPGGQGSPIHGPDQGVKSSKGGQGSHILLSNWTGSSAGTQVFGCSASAQSFGTQSRPSSAEPNRLSPQQAKEGGPLKGWSDVEDPPNRQQSLPAVPAAVSQKTSSSQPFGSQGHSNPVFGREARRPGQKLPEASVPHPLASELLSSPADGPLQNEPTNSLQRNFGETEQPKKRAHEELQPTTAPEPQTSKRQRLASASAEPASKKSQLEAAPTRHTVTAERMPGSGPSTFDPLGQHRPFCSWVLYKEDQDMWRSGWRWTLETLVPDQQIPWEEGSKTISKRTFDSATRLRQALGEVYITYDRKWEA